MVNIIKEKFVNVMLVMLMILPWPCIFKYVSLTWQAIHFTKIVYYLSTVQDIPTQFNRCSSIQETLFKTITVAAELLRTPWIDKFLLKNRQHSPAFILHYIPL